MLRQRVITAICLVAVLMAIFYSGYDWLFALFLLVFFGAASWENARFFENPYPKVIGVIGAVIFGVLAFAVNHAYFKYIAYASAAIWLFYLLPSLGKTIPSQKTFGSTVYQVFYWITILGSFLSTLVIYERSKWFLLSVLVIVWLADIGAYFAGRAFGVRKLAPSISPGKTWEGVAGGALSVAVVAFGVIVANIPQENIAKNVFVQFGWGGVLVVMVILVAFSVIGDLIESKLKRRCGLKDSSGLLPGHGGVLDRFDSLIPVMSLAVIFGTWV